MSQNYLGWRLGAISSPAYQRHLYERQVKALIPQVNTTFDFRTAKKPHDLIQPAGTRRHDSTESSATSVAHIAGTNCLAISKPESNTLLSGGADGTIHLWSLSSPDTNGSRTHRPSASLTRSAPAAHTHAITSLSIYPFDPIPQTLISTSHDKSLKLTAIGPHSLQPLTTLPTAGTPYTHHLSPLPSAHPLIALGTSSPHIPLLDLRSPTGTFTHSLPGHNGPIYTLSFSPVHPHLLASADANGLVLLFDIRRANPAFASLDLDDAIGVTGDNPNTGYGTRSPVLNYNARAHSGAITSISWAPNGSKLITTGHDQRIRLWDTSTGRNELVHFGPRIRNERVGQLAPLITPSVCGLSGREILIWPNDDGKGELLMCSLREGNLLGILRTPGVRQSKKGRLGKLTSGGRINGCVWRWNGVEGSGVEMYSAHGDGRIVAWAGRPVEDEEIDVVSTIEEKEEEHAEQRKKRKVDALEGLVEGLTGRKPGFSQR